jgi:excisionase family DNA binding protein
MFTPHKGSKNVSRGRRTDLDSHVPNSNSPRASGVINWDKPADMVGATQHPVNARIRLYTIDDAAKVLHLKRTWLYERTRKNAIPHHRFGKYIRFTEADLDAIITMAGQPNRSDEFDHA